MKLNFKKLDLLAGTPVHGSEHSAGIDLKACIADNVVMPCDGAVTIIPTKIAVQIPNGYFGMVCPRSGLAAKNGITVLNSPGIIDADYRGELMLILINHSKTPFIVENGMRLAQLIIVPYEKTELVEVDDLESSSRGSGGLGSSGLK